MGHKIGLASAYYKPTQEDMLNEYMKAVNLLTINEENRLKQKVENVESSNHIEKCPYCEHEDQPYFLKIHLMNAHKEQQNGI